MDVDLVNEVLRNNIALWVTAIVPGVVAVILSIWNAIWSFLQRKKQLEYDKKLENYKSKLEGKTYISRAMFDKELSIYQDLISKFYEAYSHMELIAGINDSGKRIISKDEISLENPNLETLYSKTVDEGAITQIQIEDIKRQISIHMLSYKKAVGASRAFIPHINQKLFIDIYDKSFLFATGIGGSKADWNDVLITIGHMQEELRRYLNSLIVIEYEEKHR